MKIYETYKLAKRFKNLTGLSLRRFVDITSTGDVLLNTFALEDYFQPTEDESLEDCLNRCLPPIAVEILKELLYK